MALFHLQNRNNLTFWSYLLMMLPNEFSIWLTCTSPSNHSGCFSEAVSLVNQSLLFWNFSSMWLILLVSFSTFLISFWSDFLASSWTQLSPLCGQWTLLKVALWNVFLAIPLSLSFLVMSLEQCHAEFLSSASFPFLIMVSFKMSVREIFL